MPRKGEVRRREIIPDPKYHDRLVTKFMNNMMLRGKKSLVEGIFYGALDLVNERTKGEVEFKLFPASQLGNAFRAGFSWRAAAPKRVAGALPELYPHR